MRFERGMTDYYRLDRKIVKTILRYIQFWSIPRTPPGGGRRDRDRLGGLTLGSPGLDNQGHIDLSYDLASYPWLRGDWDGDSSYDDSPTSRATFGIYKANDRVAFIRELY